MYIGVMKKGDSVICVNSDMIAIRRTNGEVDVIPLLKDESGLRVDTEGIVTIGYGNNTIQETIGDVTVTKF